MTKPIEHDPIYRRRAFDADVIELCCRWYVTYRFSYRDLAVNRRQPWTPTDVAMC